MRFGNLLLKAGIAGLTLVALTGLLAPWIAPYSPSEQPDSVHGKHRPPLTGMAAVLGPDGRFQLYDRIRRLPNGLEVEFEGAREVLPADEVANLTDDGVADRRFFLLGSDRFSRDIFSRVVHGTRISLMIGVLSLTLSLLIGIGAGALAALGPRWLDTVLMRLVDGLLSLPWILLLIILVAILPSSGEWILILLLGGTTWMGIARLVRSEIMSLGERDFVIAARGLGAGPFRVFFHHLLPNALTPILVDATLRIGSLILIESTLSFLGFGVQEPTPSWGNMIATSRPYLSYAWWTGVFPGLALLGTVISLHLVTDGLRDLLDPRSRSGKPVGWKES